MNKTATSLLRHATPEEIAGWDDLVTKNPSGGDILQGKVFAEVKARHGWKPMYMVYELASQKVATLYLTRQIPLIGQLWYTPKGPGVTDLSDLKAILGANRQYAKNKPIFAFKIDPEVPKAAGYPPELKKVHNIQANASTVIIDLTPSEEDILASFRQRARRAIRQAQAAGVTIKTVEPSANNLATMYALYSGTGQRAGFYIRSLAYYEALWRGWTAAGQGQLFFAYQGSQVAAAAFITIFGQKGLYKDGASLDQPLNGTPHLLHWEITRWLKSRSMTTYDLHGTPPADQLDNPNHRLYGLGVFKTSFSNQLTEYVGTLDQVIRPKAYKIWQKLGERLSQSAELRLKRRVFY